ncbi:MAG: endolytic transglycosylase MltG [Solitalea sp.]
MKKKTILFTLFALAIVSLGVAGWLYLRIYSPNLQLKNPEQPFYLHIPTGADFRQVKDSLEKHGVLKNTRSFEWVAGLMEYPQLVKAGRYRLQDGMHNRALVSKLRSGNQDAVNLTFNNIRKKEHFAAFLGRELEPDSLDFIELMNDSAFVGELGFSTETIYTMFIPNTYQVFWNSSPKDFFQRMHRDYEKFWTASRRAKADSIGLTPQEVSILASIVDQETSKKDEMPTIAGVYMNRLKSGRRLEADPTVIFALDDFSIRRVLYKHLQTPSPYNTYVVTGLPPGPITMPSEAAIRAVLDYEDHNYIYFCAKADFSGYHAFAETHSQHLQNARAFQRALNERNILR